MNYTFLNMKHADILTYRHILVQRHPTRYHKISYAYSMLGAMSLLHVQCSVYLVFLLDFLFSVSNLCNNVIVLSLNDSYTGNMYYRKYVLLDILVLWCTSRERDVSITRHYKPLNMI